MDWMTCVFIASHGILGLESVIGNLAVLHSIHKFRILHTSSNVFVGNVALADFLCGLIVNPLSVVLTTNLHTDNNVCISLTWIIYILKAATTTVLVFVTIERCVAHRLPVMYAWQLDIRRARRIAALSWVAHVSFFQIPIFIRRFRSDAFVGECNFKSYSPLGYLFYVETLYYFVVSAIVMSVLYLYIWWVIRKETIRDATLNTCNISLQKNVRLTKRFTIMFGVFIVSRLPVRILDILSYCNIEMPIPESTHTILYQVGIILEKVSSAVNPFILSGGSFQMRNAWWNVHLLRLSQAGRLTCVNCAKDKQKVTFHESADHPEISAPSSREQPFPMSNRLRTDTLVTKDTVVTTAQTVSIDFDEPDNRSDDYSQVNRVLPAPYRKSSRSTGSSSYHERKA